MSEKKSTEEEPLRQAKTEPARDENHEAGHRDQTTEEWFAGVGAGMKAVFHKLLDQAPPDLREKIVEKARSHGPGSAAVAVNAAAMKTRSLKAKLALKALGKLLQTLDSKDPKK